MLQVLQHTAVISARVEQAMRDGHIPWRGDHGFPTNAVSLRRYDGVNALLLNLAAERHGFRSPYWATWSQWLALRGEVRPRPAAVRPGEWSTEVVLERADGRLGRWALFNLEQVDGGPANLRRDVPALPSGAVDRLIRATSATICFRPGMEAAYYYPLVDHVVFPLRQQFLNGPGGLPAFYNSLLHELVHWTEPRLGWNGDVRERELRAEVGADFLTTELRIPRLNRSMRTNHRNFLDRWTSRMRRDSGWIFRIAADAGRAADYLLSFIEAARPRHNPPGELSFGKVAWLTGPAGRATVR
jgi:antirestriction protein ArdC